MSNDNIPTAPDTPLALAATHEFPDQLTPVALEQILPAFYRAWLHLRGAAPPRSAVELMTAQWAGEVAWGEKCHDYNVGNAKAVSGGAYDWTFFTCGEELTLAYAEQLCAGSPLVQVVGQYTMNGRAMASVRISPKHSGCCFRAFSDLLAGVTDHVSLLERRFPAAFEALWSGSPAAYAHALKLGGYYTAMEAKYSALLVGCMPRVKAAADQVDWNSLPVLNDYEAGNVMAVAAMADEDLQAAMIRERDADILERDLEDMLSWPLKADPALFG